jgi:hypothetical protein
MHVSSLPGSTEVTRRLRKDFTSLVNMINDAAAAVSLNPLHFSGQITRNQKCTCDLFICYRPCQRKRLQTTLRTHNIFFHLEFEVVAAATVLVQRLRLGFVPLPLWGQSVSITRRKTTTTEIQIYFQGRNFIHVVQPTMNITCIFLESSYCQI